MEVFNLNQGRLNVNYIIGPHKHALPFTLFRLYFLIHFLLVVNLFDVLISEPLQSQDDF